ncbi:hypothetical protein MA16_Dca016918 [Dendrobium catenatum]|uniref:Uncharacterized protein n=1 Tax=Dendrobium catenatum TaxID=906689 RepID=A0A2I0XI73_9ASPA|nr:hypothetical protein MA16_Dca016918 [Dendrobium catenatum]
MCRTCCIGKFVILALLYVFLVEGDESLSEDVRVKHLWPVVELEGEELPLAVVMLVAESLIGVEGSLSEIPSFGFSLLRKVSRLGFLKAKLNRRRSEQNSHRRSKEMGGTRKNGRNVEEDLTRALRMMKNEVLSSRLHRFKLQEQKIKRAGDTAIAFVRSRSRESRVRSARTAESGANLEKNFILGKILTY